MPETSIAYLGWVGRNNLGDELMYRLHRSRLTNGTVALAPLHWPGGKLVRRLGPDQVDTLLVGGGTLLLLPEWSYRVRIATEALSPQRVIVLGAGAEDPEFGLGTGLVSQVALTEWTDILRQADFVGVRGPRSQAYLAELGVDSRVVGDPALSIPLSVPVLSRSQSLRVGLNLSDVANGFARDGREFRAAVSQALRAWTAAGAEVLLFAMEPGDLRVMNGLGVNRAGVSSFYSSSIHETVCQLATCDVVVSERLHGAIVAAGLGLPFIHIAYKPKSWDFLESFSGSAHGVTPDSAELADVLGSATDIERWSISMDEADAIRNIRNVFRTAHRSIFPRAAEDSWR